MYTIVLAKHASSGCHFPQQHRSVRQPIFDEVWVTAFDQVQVSKIGFISSFSITSFRVWINFTLCNLTYKSVQKNVFLTMFD